MRTINGRTPLTVACQFGHHKAVGLLIGHGADLALLDNAGHSALAYAKLRVAEADLSEGDAKSAKDIVALLEAHGAA